MVSGDNFAYMNTSWAIRDAFLSAKDAPCNLWLCCSCRWTLSRSKVIDACVYCVHMRFIPEYFEEVLFGNLRVQCCIVWMLQCFLITILFYREYLVLPFDPVICSVESEGIFLQAIASDLSGMNLWSQRSIMSMEKTDSGRWDFAPWSVGHFLSNVTSTRPVSRVRMLGWKTRFLNIFLIYYHFLIYYYQRTIICFHFFLWSSRAPKREASSPVPSCLGDLCQGLGGCRGSLRRPGWNDPSPWGGAVRDSLNEVLFASHGFRSWGIPRGISNHAMFVCVYRWYDYIILLYIYIYRYMCIITDIYT